ncbi:hypothetical protein PES01_20820 [Pseudoalteromonas espejiana]|uniref:Uncharacterized protein n=1 Tax=Pseudoalteromonas espejiana TaxID=28107 RepID=A0A510XXH3_9GAMM|nr:hypothetical protein PES01_20820 [Pseudoalteromonas espejiana]
MGIKLGGSNKLIEPNNCSIFVFCLSNLVFSSKSAAFHNLFVNNLLKGFLHKEKRMRNKLGGRQ